MAPELRSATAAALVVGSLLLLSLGAPTATAGGNRVFVFCDTPPGPAWINGNGIRCGFNVKSSSTYCIHILLGVYACEDHVVGNIVGLGVYVDNPATPQLCSADCYGVNAGVWNGDPTYSLGGCFVWLENPGQDVLRICSGQDGLCIISPNIPNPICVGDIIATGLPVGDHVSHPFAIAEGEGKLWPSSVDALHEAVDDELPEL